MSHPSLMGCTIRRTNAGFGGVDDVSFLYSSTGHAVSESRKTTQGFHGPVFASLGTSLSMLPEPLFDRACWMCRPEWLITFLAISWSEAPSNTMLT